MNYFNRWNHVFKLDPEKSISDHDLKRLSTSGTDAFIIGGTDGVTFDNVSDLLDRLEDRALPCLLEVSDLEAVIPGFDGYLIPMVLNSQQKRWMFDIQHEAVKAYGDMIDWDEMVTEGYCVLNPEAKVYRKTDCYSPDQDDVRAFAQMAEHMLHLPVFYLEYSGTYGDPALVQAVSTHLNETILVYGGGITTAEQAAEMSTCADEIVVGNIIYENIEAALETVQATRTEDG